MSTSILIWVGLLFWGTGLVTILSSWIYELASLNVSVNVRGWLLNDHNDIISSTCFGLNNAPSSFLWSSLLYYFTYCLTYKLTSFYVFASNELSFKIMAPPSFLFMIEFSTHRPFGSSTIYLSHWMQIFLIYEKIKQFLSF